MLCTFLLNLCPTESNRDELVKENVLPVLVDVLNSDDPDVQYYSAAALSNLAVTEMHRQAMVAIGNNQTLKCLIRLLDSKSEKVTTSGCFKMANLIPGSIDQSPHHDWSRPQQPSEYSSCHNKFVKTTERQHRFFSPAVLMHSGPVCITSHLSVYVSLDQISD